MRRMRRLALTGFTALATIAGTAALALSGPSATAATMGTFVTSNNGSDPHVIQCNDGATAGYCLYTSQDMGQRHAYPPANYYPMRDTLVYFSTNGYNNWAYRGIAFTESKLDAWAGTHGCGPNDPKATTNVAAAPDVNPICRAYHLWAPSAVKVSNSEYWIYVPDVSNTAASGPVNIHTSSRIAVARSTNGPFGPFGYIGTVPFSSGYMSDPDVIIDGSNRYLLWADGDFDTCGGFKSAKLNTDMVNLTSGTTQTLTINGLGHATAGLGVCGNKGRPYVEGASIYKRSFNTSRPWTLFFAAKPGPDPANPGAGDVIPKECNSVFAGTGTAQTANSVIAWASATSAQGPYTYEGVVMCGSLDEWTNQATVTTTSNGRTIMIYHDGGPNKQRKLQAQCLFYGSGHVAAVYRAAPDAANGFNACTTTAADNDYKAWWGTDGQAPGLAPLLSTAGGETIAKRYAAGPWERFKFETVATGVVVIRALVNGKLMCAPNNQTPLEPTCTSTSDTKARFAREAIPNGLGHFRLKSQHNNLWVEIAGNARVYMSATQAAHAGTFALLSYR